MEFVTVRAELQLTVPGQVRGLPRSHTAALTPDAQHTNLQRNKANFIDGLGELFKLGEN